jgi:regulatory protein
MSNDIRRAALNLLARREHSTTELLRKLSSKDFDPATLQTVLATLITEGLLSDERFTESFIHYRRGMGYGPIRIQAELRDRGIADDLIQRHLVTSAEHWLTEAQYVWKKRFKNRLPTDYKTRAQQMRFLQYRGFTLEQINGIFRHDEE